MRTSYYTPEGKIREAKRLISKGVPVRQIARRLGMSRQKVSTLDPLYIPPKSREPRKKKYVDKYKEPANPVNKMVWYRTVERYLCDGCRDFVILNPCPACVARSALVKEAV